VYGRNQHKFERAREEKGGERGERGERRGGNYPETIKEPLKMSDPPQFTAKSPGIYIGVDWLLMSTN
jgi:hypothetical protein